MNLLKTMLLLASLSAGSVALAQPTVEVRGEVQIWKRKCESAAVCENTFTTSERLPIDTILTQPVSDWGLSIYEETFSFLETKLLFQTFWRLGTEEVTGYLTHQLSLSLAGEGGEVPLSRCAIYQGVTSPAFPVGACTGFHESDDSLYEYGVTMWKIAPTSRP